MQTLPADCSSTILLFQTLFSKRTWHYAQTLLIGAILAPAQRTVTAALRVMGLAQEEQFQRYHRLLNRDRWSLRQGARRLLLAVIDQCVPTGRIVLALDDTLERRRGKMITATGIYRDAVRSSHSHFVKTSALRWLCLMAVVPVPFSRRRWAVPVLTRLAPSERYNQRRGQRHKKLTDHARGLLLTVRRWLPGREIVCVGDSSFAALEFLAAVQSQMTVITRLRLDAALYAPAPQRPAKQRGRPACKGPRLPKLIDLLNDPTQRWTRLILPQWYRQKDRCVEILSGTAVWYHSGKPTVPLRWVLVRDPLGKLDPQAFLSTESTLEPQQILAYYLDRWQVEVTFREVREHLGVETQRQWSERAIARTTPVLFGLYSIITLIATQLHTHGGVDRRSTAWYVKEQCCFSDAIAAVRRVFWHAEGFSMSGSDPDQQQIPPELLRRLIDTLCYAS